MIEHNIPKGYNNKKLAEDYGQVKTHECGGYDSIWRKYQRAIEKCPVNIPNLYKKKGTLKDLEVAEIGQVTKHDLEDILRYGKERVAKMDLSDDADPENETRVKMGTIRYRPVKRNFIK